MNNLGVILLLTLIPIAFVVGYFFDPYPNSITINSRDDLREAIWLIEDEMEGTDIDLYYHDIESLVRLNENITAVSINLVSPNSYPISEPWDYETWKFHFFGNKSDSKYIAYMNSLLNETEPEIGFDDWQEHFFSKRAPQDVDYLKWAYYFFNKSDPNLEDRPRYIHVKISPGEKGVLLIQKGNWTYHNLALE